MGRRGWQDLADFLTFPLRALLLIEDDGWGLTALRSERLAYVAREVQGYCLDVGCGKHNRFVREFLGGRGKGIDIFPYEGLAPEDLVDDLTRFPFPDRTFATVTFIANLNHVPRPQRDAELSEAFRCLSPGGNIVVTMGNPAAEIAAHLLVRFYDRFLHTRYDVDGMRGMSDSEAYYLGDQEIVARLRLAGFRDIRKTFFATQWGLNHLFVGWKA